MDNNYYLGKILSIDYEGTKVKDDAFSVNYDKNGNYVLKVYIADPITNNQHQLDNITRLHNSSTGRLISTMKEFFAEYGLSEAEEKRCFCFTFVVDVEQNILSFDVQKQLVQIDLELEYDDVFDTFDEENELAGYLYFCNEFAELLYKKRSNGREFNSYGNEYQYDLPFPREFITLVNYYLADMLNKLNIPFIYDVREATKKDYSDLMWYYTSVPTKTHSVNCEYYYGAFTSPIQDFEDLKDLEIFNNMIFLNPDEKEKEKLIDKYKRQLDGYICLKDKADDRYKHKRGGTKK